MGVKTLLGPLYSTIQQGEPAENGVRIWEETRFKDEGEIHLRRSGESNLCPMVSIIGVYIDLYNMYQLVPDLLFKRKASKEQPKHGTYNYSQFRTLPF